MPLSLLRRVNAAALIMSAATLVAGAQTLGTPERYTATAVNESGRGTTPIQIAVDRWSTDKERDAGETFGRLTTQLDGALADIEKPDAPRVVIAYEPVWAIGTGRTATVGQADEAHRFIREKLRDRWGDVAEEVRIQYGGSVKPDNAEQLMDCIDVDGALVGGASLAAESFIAIVRAAL